MHKKSKKIAVMAMALTLTATGIGFNGGNMIFSNDNTITASAVQKIEVNAKKYGFSADSKYIEKVIIRNGDNVLKELDFATFVNDGYTLNANSGITVEFTYKSSSVVYDAITGEVISHTGRSYPTRKKVYIPVDLLLNEAIDGTVFRIYSSEDYYFSAFDEAISVTKDDLWYNYKEKGIEYVEADYKYRGNGTIFIGTELQASATGSSKELRRYNPFTMEFEGEDLITPDLNQGRAERMKVFSTEAIRNKFPYCDSVEITINDKYDEKFVTTEVGVLDDNDKKLYLSLSDLKQTADIYTTVRSMNFKNFCTIKVNYSNGTEEYLGMADCFHKVRDTRREKPVGKDDFGDNVYPAVDTNGEGEGVISERTLDFIDETGASSIYIYEGSNIIDSVSFDEYVSGGYTIADYKSDKNYYVKVDTNNTDNDMLWYKYNCSLNAWVKTVDTRKQSDYEIKVNIINFPEALLFEDNSGIVTSSYNSPDRREVYKIVNGDINKGNKSFTINGRDDTYMVFTGKRPEDNSYELRYCVMGIDLELSTEYDTVLINIKNEDGKNHSYTLDGTLEDNGLTAYSGKKVHAEFEDNGEDVTLRLPDGEYDIVRDDGYKAHIVIDKDNSEDIKGSVGEDGTYNSDDEDGHKKGDKADDLSFEPKGIHNFVVKSPDGKELFKGDVIDEGLDSTEDLKGRETPDNKENFEDTIVKYPYFIYEETAGTVNSTNPADLKKETGYLVADSKGNLTKKSILKGDVNLDGKLGIADLVIAQKYLLNNLDSKTVFTIDNFIAMDICEDGSGDVFDMVQLRKTVSESIF